MNKTRKVAKTAPVPYLPNLCQRHANCSIIKYAATFGEVALNYLRRDKTKWKKGEDDWIGTVPCPLKGLENCQDSKPGPENVKIFSKNLIYEKAGTSDRKTEKWKQRWEKYEDAWASNSKKVIEN